MSETKKTDSNVLLYLIFDKCKYRCFASQLVFVETDYS